MTGHQVARLRRQRGSLRKPEAGSGTIYVLTIAIVLAFATFVVVLIGQAMAIRHRADAAADLSALAGADSVRSGGEPCGAAARIAAANGGHLVSCVTATAAGGDPAAAAGQVVVQVTATGTALGGRVLTATAQARAGQATP